MKLSAFLKFPHIIILFVVMATPKVHSETLPSPQKKNVGETTNQKKLSTTGIGITGNTLAPITPWIAQSWAAYSGFSTVCTADAISASWILLARHCTNDSSGVTVYYSTQDQNNTPSTTGLTADYVYYPSEQQSYWNQSVGAGDVALLHLKSPHVLDSYAPLDLDYVPNVGDAATIYGYAGRVGLKQAAVLVYNIGPNEGGGFGGVAIGVSGNPDHCEAGDSGGPLLANNRFIGVASTAGGNNCYYMSLNRVKDWIKSTSNMPSISAPQPGQTVFYLYVPAKGTGMPGAIISVAADKEPKPFCTTTVDSHGSWDCGTHSMKNGKHTLLVTQILNNTYSPASQQTFYVEDGTKGRRD